MIVLDGLSVGHRVGRRRPPRTVLAGVSARAGAGELTVLVGPNGTGKSTLLHTVAGLLPPLAGTASLDGADLTALPPAERARRLAVVLTERVEAGLLSVEDLVALGRHPHTGPTGALRDTDRKVVAAAVDAAGAAHLAGRRVAELSDGERQRVLVARALAQEPAVLLLDEPTAFLDVSARVGLLGLLRRLAREDGLCVLVSTHDLEPALRVADQVWLLDRAGGLRTGPPEALVADGSIAEVFDGPGLAFDPAAGAFTVRPAKGGRPVRVAAPEPEAALVARLLTREGWAVGREGGAVVTRTAPGRFTAVDGGGATVEGMGWAELAAWARRGGRQRVA
ncbi:iron complex transport system ATP-binding protein [Pseudonocardia hierapolitana]|uniref:Iron complex transport system ATP-binding protein n=1 Tax=Pseudonocardia hierapolitana TaxID=1128676 RepID=A0A561T2J3_9PSEU|nr:iron complex transport system ATP-binding protein [Pseudonocardia hierapolitana]